MATSTRPVVDSRGVQDDEEAPPPPTNEPPTTEGAGGGSGLVRVTVNLTLRSHRDLLRLSKVTGLGKTDVVNRAVQVYALIEDLLSQDNGALTIKHKNGAEERIYIL